MQIPALQTYSTGAGLLLDGVNEFTQTPVLPDLSSSSVTLLFLGRFNAFSNPTYLFTPINNRIPGTFAITVSSTGVVSFFRSTASFYILHSSISIRPISLNELTLLVCQYNIASDTAKYYIYDNTLGKDSSDSNAPFPFVVFSGTRVYTLGADSTVMPSRNFNGIIYDFAYYDRLLTSQEIDEYWNTLGSYYPKDNLLLKYAFNQKQGTTLLDSSGNGYNGTLINYTGLETSVGAGNKWVDDLENPILV
jgi:hypothetical protein